MENIKSVVGSGYIKRENGEVINFSNRLSEGYYTILLNAMSSGGLLVGENQPVGNPSGSRFNLVNTLPYDGYKQSHSLLNITRNNFTLVRTGLDYAVIESTGTVTESGTVVAGGFDIICDNISGVVTTSPLSTRYEPSVTHQFGLGVDSVWLWHEATGKMITYYQGTIFSVTYDMATGQYGQYVIEATANVGNYNHILTDYKDRIFIISRDDRLYTYNALDSTFTSVPMSNNNTMTSPCYDIRNGYIISSQGVILRLDGTVSSGNRTITEDAFYIGSDLYITRYGIYRNYFNNNTYNDRVSSTNAVQGSSFNFYDSNNNSLQFQFAFGSLITRQYKLPNLYTTAFPLNSALQVTQGESLTIGYKFTWGG